MDETKSDQLRQKEEIEFISGIPFSKGPFKTKEGPRGPLRENLYLNKTMRRLLLNDEDAKTGTAKVGEEEFEIRQARYSLEDGRVRNVVHPDNAAAVREFLGGKLKEGSELQERTGVEFYCGEFKTQKEGVKFPEGRTIYATKKLRTLLGVDDKTGEVEIDGKKYKVRQGKKPVEGDEFVNVVHPVEQAVVQRFLLERQQELHETREEAGSRIEETLDSEK